MSTVLDNDAKLRGAFDLVKDEPLDKKPCSWCKDNEVPGKVGKKPCGSCEGTGMMASDESLVTLKCKKCDGSWEVLCVNNVVLKGAYNALFQHYDAHDARKLLRRMS